MNWVQVNLPWSEVPGSWKGFPEPNTDAEERVRFGKTFKELLSESNAEFFRRRKLVLERYQVTEEDGLPPGRQQFIQDLREEKRRLQDIWWSIVEQLPGRVAWQATWDEALRKHKETYFAPQAKPGMVVETREGERFIIGDVSTSGGIGTEHFPLADKFIVRYCQLELPE